MITKIVAEIASETIFLSSPAPILGRGANRISSPVAYPAGVGFDERICGTIPFATHLVEVDPETGNVRMLNDTASHDGGKVINQAIVEGRVEEGIIQEICYGVNGALIVKDGKILNSGFTDLRVPPAKDTDFKIHTDFFVVPEERSPYSVKDLDEPPMVPPPPALVNAILDAIGNQVTETPLNPER